MKTINTSDGVRVEAYTHIEDKGVVLSLFGVAGYVHSVLNVTEARELALALAHMADVVEAHQAVDGMADAFFLPRPPR